MENTRNKNFNFGEKIKNIRKERNYTVRQLALYSGVSYSFISQIENYKREIPKEKTLKKLAKGLHISEEEIFKLAGIEPTSDNLIPVSDTNTVSIPIIGEIACGTPILAKQNIEGYLPTLKEVVPNGKNFYLKCSGNSMAPIIQDGAYVLIHQQPEVESGEIAAVLLNDNETTLKWVKYQGDQIILIPDNKDPMYEPIILNKDNPGRIIGKAIQVQFKL